MFVRFTYFRPDRFSSSSCLPAFQQSVLPSRNSAGLNRCLFLFLREYRLFPIAISNLTSPFHITSYPTSYQLHIRFFPYLFTTSRCHCCSGRSKMAHTFIHQYLPRYLSLVSRNSTSVLLSLICSLLSRKEKTG